MARTIKIERSPKNKKWYGRLVGRNGRDTTWVSTGGKQRGYARRIDCVNSAKDVFPGCIIIIEPIKKRKVRK